MYFLKSCLNNTFRAKSCTTEFERPKLNPQTFAMDENERLKPSQPRQTTILAFSVAGLDQKHLYVSNENFSLLVDGRLSYRGEIK